MTKTLTIGSVNEAEDAALQAAYDHLLAGWKYLGAGIHRTAYLSPSGVVYKVAHDGQPGAAAASRSELEAARILSRTPAPEGFGVPKTDGVQVLGLPVVCMEYIDGKGEGLMGDDFTTAALFYRNNDIHPGNIIRSKNDGLLYMIDLGFFREEFSESEVEHFSDDWNPCPICRENMDDCGCCQDCEESEDNCCCDYCPECTMHIDDCQGMCAAGEGPM